MPEDLSQTDRLKARLTGALALLIIGAVAWVWLLDADSPVEPIVQETSIPPAPDIQPFAVPEPVAPAKIAPVGSERDAPVAAERTVVQPAPAATVATAATTHSTKAPKPVAKTLSAAGKSESSGSVSHEKFEMDTHGLPVAWVVQVGAMGSRASADKLRDQLIGKGFKAYTAVAKAAGGSTVFKVYVGPKLSRDRADAQKKAIDAALNMQSMVVRFSP